MSGFARNTRIRAGLVLVTTTGGLALGTMAMTYSAAPGVSHGTKPQMTYSMTYSSQPRVLAMTYSGQTRMSYSARS